MKAGISQVVLVRLPVWQRFDVFVEGVEKVNDWNCSNASWKLVDTQQVCLSKDTVSRLCRTQRFACSETYICGESSIPWSVLSSILVEQAAPPRVRGLHGLVPRLVRA